jgi:uncharacterized protein with ParB-like and HNH nuclease domain
MNDYNLDTDKLYVKQIFDKENFYNIPEYQRPYVWQKDQVEVLLEDFKEAFDRDKNKEYFLGCMIWNTKDVTLNGADHKVQDILDGQQRFISLYLLHGVIRDLSENDAVKLKINSRLIQAADEIDNIPSRNRVTFDIRHDKDFLNEYLITTGGTLNFEELKTIRKSKDSSTSVRNMANALLIIHQWFKKLKDKKEATFSKYLFDFFVFISNKVLALYLATPNNLDDAYNLFTVLNSRGLQLQVSDILRAQNLRVVQDERDRKRLAEKWSSFEDNIGPPYRGFDDFLWSLIDIKMKYSGAENKSLQKGFEHLWNRNIVKKGRQTFDEIEKYVNHYESITNGSITSRETGQLFVNLNFILTSVYGSVYMSPLLHYRECFGDYRITEFILKLDNLLSAAWLTGKRGAKTRIFVLLRKMDEIRKDRFDTASIQNAADDFLECEQLEYSFGHETGSTIIPINDFFEMLHSEDFGLYSGTKLNKIRYLLLKLDIITLDFGSKIQFDRYSSSVEHIMPRKIEGTSWNIDANDHQNWLHRIGNLALINRKKNASLSNKTYSEKKSRYKGSIESRQNTNFIFINYENWSIDSIRNNQNRIVEILKEYYLGNSIDTLIRIKKGTK